MNTASVVRLMPHEYLHVENTNTCEVLTLVGPITYTLHDYHRKLHETSQPCVVVPPSYFVEVKNPMHMVPTTLDKADAPPVYTLLRSSPGSFTGLEVLRYSRWKVPYGSSELRFFDESPFPLLPDETVDGPSPMPLLTASEALILEALAPHDVVDPVTAETVHRAAQECFLFKGPGLYTPRLDERIVKKVTGVYVSPPQVCYLSAKHDFVDDEGVSRVAGEQWIVQAHGIFFAHPAVVLQLRDAYVLSSLEALTFVSYKAFYDEEIQVAREAQKPYLISYADTKDGTYVPRPHEVFQGKQRQVHLSVMQYCVIVNPIGSDGTRKRQQAEVRVGKQSFMLQPGECCTKPLTALVLSQDEALLHVALQAYTEADGTLREGGSRWLVQGPRQYIPPVYARVVERRRIIKIDENCGVYVRNIHTGQVRSVFGKPFMLGADEELWERPISAYVRRLLAEPRQSLRVTDMSAKERAEASLEEGWAATRIKTNEVSSSAAAVEMSGGGYYSASSSGESLDSYDNLMDKDERADEMQLLDAAIRNAHPPSLSRDIGRYRVITANVEHNTLMRLYDTSTGLSRVVAGPATVFLEPHEHFTPFSLSGGCPKEPHQIHSLSLYLGPDYMADVIEVETRDHVRLRLHLAYNWEFGSLASNRKAGGVDAERAFTIPDFIGEACKALASRVRSVIAGQAFEFFHCNSSTLIRQAIFTPAEDGSIVSHGDALCFTANGLYITTVDVQSVEPVNTKTRTALTKSVQLAVEIITKAQESDASHQAALLEQEAKGALDLQVMHDRAKAEQQRTELLRVMGDNTALEQASASRAQALAESAARLAEVQGELDATPIRCAAHIVSMDTELEVLRRRAELDLAHRQSMNNLAIDKIRKLSDIEATKYEKIMASLGKETLVAIASAGPKLKAQLLGELGLQGFLVTDGKTPINILNLADKMTAEPSATTPPSAAPGAARVS
ncbi:major vault protein-like protein [Leishmania tarentolae]|uniref:Major vault protein-like protein n=1 Tax=Leishmania tarentolae TaxID=5689 RepID=A0A640KGN1_LEITA|nr:major vault protein-like protein [Leishmania tarentolae]